MTPCEAYLGPAFEGPCAGAVHSVFAHAVNLRLQTPAGWRLVTLCAPGLPRLPDSIQAPQGTPGQLREGMAASLSHGRLEAGPLILPLARSADWDGRIAPLSGPPSYGPLLRLTHRLSGGFDRLPPEKARRALAALATPQAAQWLGLGPGLTPSFDDACVGFMAMCRAGGRRAPFSIPDDADTTEVSLRYLLLAGEGRFSEAVGDVVRAVFGRGDLERAVETLCRFGATSGADTLMGMRRYCLEYEN